LEQIEQDRYKEGMREVFECFPYTLWFAQTWFMSSHSHSQIHINIGFLFTFILFTGGFLANILFGVLIVHICYMLCPPYPSWFNQPYNSRKIYKLWSWHNVILPVCDNK
jgi:hypothetical protein